MKFNLEIEEKGVDPSTVTNYEEVKQEIVDKLQGIKARCPNLTDKPLIYHVDVAAMYPNIILSNRLQPVAIVNEKICAGCIFNKPENDCKRNLDWQWRGDLLPLNRREFEMVKGQL
jgi:DNA polymerase epsilon subunit 1